MRKISNTGKRTSSNKQWFRKWVRQLFVGLLTRQNREREQVKSEFEEIKELIEKVSRDLAEQRKRNR